MGEWKINVPTRFDAEMIAFIDGEKERHKFENRSQYIRAAMEKWKRLIIAGPIQLLDVPAQQEQREKCEQCEQSFPVEIGMKPPHRAKAAQDTLGRRVSYSATISRRGRAHEEARAWSITSFLKPLNFNRFGMTRRVA